LGAAPPANAFNRFEADLLPRPNGKRNGTVRVTDWVQIGRFVLGLDTVSNADEFTRADCAPRGQGGSMVLGDGEINLMDFVQAGRYAAALDPVTPEGGPLEPALTPSGPSQDQRPLSKMDSSATAQPRQVRASSIAAKAGQDGAVDITLASQGDENAISFSLNFDPTRLGFKSATLATGGPAQVFMVNTNAAASGRIGVILAMSPGSAFAAGAVKLVQLSFTSRPSDSGQTTQLSFGDQPVARQVADVTANRLPAAFLASAVSIPPSSTKPSLNLLSQTADGSLRLQLSGGASGTYILETSTDLSNWSPAQTDVVTANILEIAPPAGARSSTRFYRVRSQP